MRMRMSKGILRVKIRGYFRVMNKSKTNIRIQMSLGISPTCKKGNSLFQSCPVGSISNSINSERVSDEAIRRYEMKRLGGMR